MTDCDISDDSTLAITSSLNPYISLFDLVNSKVLAHLNLRFNNSNNGKNICLINLEKTIKNGSAIKALEYIVANFLMIKLLFLLGLEEVVIVQVSLKLLIFFFIF